MQHAFDLEIPQTLADLCQQRRMALVVYDMQVGILAQLPNAAQITSAVAQVLEAARAGGVRVVYTRHMSLPVEVAGVTQLRTAMEWQRVSHVSQVIPAFPRDSPQFQLVEGVAPLASEAIFDKISMSAFVGTPLDMVLRDCGLNAFVIVGVALEVGIEPTIRHAMDLGYIPVVVTDACGWGHEAAASRSLEALAFAGGSIQTDMATLCPLLRRSRP